MTLLALAIFFFGTVAICCTVLGLAIHVWSAAAQEDDAATMHCEEDDAVSSVVSMSSDDDDAATMPISLSPATTMPMPLVISHCDAESDWNFPSPGGRHSRTLKVRKKHNIVKFH